MKRLRAAWSRLCDRELERAPAFPDRDSIDPGAWNSWVGRTGERLAAMAVRREGGKVLYRNFRPKEGGEVDLVYREGEILVFAEVKTRTSELFARPARAVDRGKQRLIIRGANAWLRELNFPTILFRYDIIEVVLLPGQAPKIHFVRGAFTSPQKGLGY